VSVFPMSAPIPDAQSTTPWPRIRLRRRRPADESQVCNLTLVSAGTGVPLRLAAESPTLMVAAVEDLCWRLAVEDLQTRRPRRWHRRASAAWRDEQARLEAKRSRIAEMTASAVSEL
jgi:hypothetical protein